LEGNPSPHTHVITVHNGEASVSEPRLLIDTNIFLEVLLGQERAADCLTLMEALERGAVLACVTSFSP
jgi:hypothetical protein